MNTRRFKLFTLLALLLLNGCSTPHAMFIYNYSGSAIDLSHTEYIVYTRESTKEKEMIEHIPDRTYRIYPANGFGPKHLECGFEINFSKNGTSNHYFYDTYDPSTQSCIEKLQALAYGEGYYVVITATGVFIKGADGQWIPMTPQQERPAAALVRKTHPANQQLSPEGKFS